MNPAEFIFDCDASSTISSELVEQIQNIDLNLIQELIQQKQSQVNWTELASHAKPPSAIRVNGDNRFSSEEAIAKGSQMLSQGSVAMILVAGGQGTRLGFDSPKGMFPIGPVSERTLFEIFIDQIKAIGRRYGVTIPLFLMTSPATHEETLEHFAKNENFGLNEKELTVFCQGTMPAVDRETGKILLESKTEIARSPDGHGGMLDALAKSGCLQTAIDRGIEYFFYGQIDNPLVQICDPELLGYHALCESEMTTQVVTKAHPLEKVGNVVEIDGKVQIIEYSDLPEEFALKTDDDGNPFLWAGNIAVHVFNSSFLDNAGQQASSLPFHLAFKRVPFVNGRGEMQNPELPNAIKFEKFIFDLLPHAKNAIAVEVEKSKGFAPVKNADGAPADTPSLAREAISNLHLSWLQVCGVQVENGASVEIHPAFAINATELAGKDLPSKIDSDTYFGPPSVQ